MFADGRAGGLSSGAFELQDPTAGAACCCDGRAWQDATGAGKGWIVFVNSAPVVPGFKKVVSFGLIFVNVGEFFDEFPEIGGRDVEEGEEGVN